MTNEYYITGRKKIKHLTLEKRGQIEILLKRGLSKSEIASVIGISRSTLYEELKRGTVEQLDTNLKTYKSYYSDVGQRIYESHRLNSKKPYKLSKAFAFIGYAKERILKDKLYPVFLTLDERILRKRIIVKIYSKSTSAVKDGISKIVNHYGELAPKIFKSITSDNGSEFSELSKAMPFADIYYAHPYSSFERGTNEKQNSLVPRFFLRGKD